MFLTELSNAWVSVDLADDFTHKAQQWKLLVINLLYCLLYEQVTDAGRSREEAIVNKMMPNSGRFCCLLLTVSPWQYQNTSANSCSNWWGVRDLGVMVSTCGRMWNDSLIHRIMISEVLGQRIMLWQKKASDGYCPNSFHQPRLNQSSCVSPYHHRLLVLSRQAVFVFFRFFLLLSSIFCLSFSLIPVFNHLRWTKLAIDQFSSTHYSG